MSTNVEQNMEIFKKIQGEWAQEYEISNLGRVRYFFESTCKSKYDRIESCYRYLKPAILKIGASNGYKLVRLSKGHYKYHTQYIHRLIASAFIPNLENKPQVNHINGNSLDNRIENLEWVTSKENIHHAWNHGMCRAWNTGIGSGSDKIKKEVENLREKGLSQREIGRRLGMYQSEVSRILNNKQKKSRRTA